MRHHSAVAILLLTHAAQTVLSCGGQSGSAVNIDWKRSKGTIMKLSNIGLALGIAAATIGLAAHAGDHRKASKDPRHAASGMQLVAVSPKAGEPGHGWQYFSDARKSRAVVIHPNGDYYYSRGEGLQLVFKAKAAA